MLILHASLAPIITMVFLLSAPRWMPFLQPSPPIWGRKEENIEERKALPSESVWGWGEVTSLVTLNWISLG